MTLTDLQVGVRENLILVSGPPGAGKSTFCHQVALRQIANGRSIIFVTTEQKPADILTRLRERGMGTAVPDNLLFVDAFSATVGLSREERPDTVSANCHDFNSLSIAISKQQNRLHENGILLICDALTSPYLFGGTGVIKFMRLFLSKFAAAGNAVIATIDEGCGQAEDLGAMHSIADGLVRVTLDRQTQTFAVVKHPLLSPDRFAVSLPQKYVAEQVLDEVMDPEFMGLFFKSLISGKGHIRPQTGDFVNPAWTQLALWSGNLWDPTRFPSMMYENSREDQSQTGSDMHIALVPQPFKSMFQLIKGLRKIGLFPKSFSRVADIKRVWFFNSHMVLERVLNAVAGSNICQSNPASTSIIIAFTKAQTAGISVGWGQR